jgi:hypothetical protein
MPLTPEAAEPRTATLDLSAHIAGLYDVAAELRPTEPHDLAFAAAWAEPLA